MGDNIYLGDRDGVRTPMQWTGDRNAGFSRADFAGLYAAPDHRCRLRLPEHQRRGARAGSLVTAQLDEAAGRAQKAIPGLRTGDPGVSPPPQSPGPRLHLRSYGDETILAVANVSRFVQPFSLDLTKFPRILHPSNSSAESNSPDHWRYALFSSPSALTPSRGFGSTACRIPSTAAWSEHRRCPPRSYPA